MTVSSFQTIILNNLTKNKVIFFGELAAVMVQKSCNENATIIDSCEIQDCKLLTGTYAFETTGMLFKNGLLVQAMLNGSTFIVLNIDKNLKLYNYLQSVIETDIIYIDGTTKKAIDGFKIFYTSTENFDNKKMTSIGPINLTFGEFLHSISEEVDLKRDIKSSMMFSLQNICNLQLNTLLDINTYKKVHRLLKAKILDTEMLYEHIVDIFIMGNEEKIRNEKITALRELLCLGKQQYSIEENYIFNDFNVNHKNIGTINTIIRHIKSNNPIVITGETGVGKTTLIQKISEKSLDLFGHHTNLVVFNMSHDVDMQDLIGLYESFPMHKILTYKKKYGIKAQNNLEILQELGDYILRSNNNIAKKEYKEIQYLIANFDKKFIFRENVLLKAIKNGDWLLLDEINLAPNDVLEALNAMLEQGGIYVLERGDLVRVPIHPNFRIVACMNPGTDYGKKNFKSNIFSEVFYDDFSNDYDQLLQIAYKILVNSDNIKNENLQKNTTLVVKNKNISDAIVRLENLAEAISMLFVDIKKSLLERTLIGNEIEPVLSGRTFTRLLHNVKYCNIHELIEILFYTQFCVESYVQLDKLVSKYFVAKVSKISHSPYFIDSDYYITKGNQKYIRVIEGCIRLDLPVILQGSTSTGKTSSLYYLAKKYNKTLHRINNHDNTEIGDYLGSYKCSKDGDMFFEKGLLIRAMINGDWLLIDELNLAQSEVLEVLNRLLDDNKEIMCNNEIIRPHKNFRLFATQNLNYSGRKKLSKAFRNRFVEVLYDKLYVDDIKELLTCKRLPKSYIDLITKVFDKLSSLRSYNSYITARDIFKWVNGNLETKETLFIAGLSVIYEKQRSHVDHESILQIFEMTFKLDRIIYFQHIESTDFVNMLDIKFQKANNCIIVDDFVFTRSYIKLFNLLYENYIKNNAVLIVGETGIGKTKCIQLLSKVCNKKLFTVGMHENIDSGDFIGNFTVPVAWNDGPLLKSMKSGGMLLIDEINLGQSSVLEQLNSVFEKNKSLYIADINQIVYAVEGFNIFACMNPGTDFGKKELSPALRNRFTEIFFEICDDEKKTIFEILLRRHITESRFCDRFLDLLHQNSHLISELSLRKTTDIIESINSFFACKHDIVVKNAKITADFVFAEIFYKNTSLSTDWDLYIENNTNYIGVSPYYFEERTYGNLPILSKNTKKNMKMLLKALIASKPILLKGSPGVGKTSFIVQLAKYINRKCIRINLSDETEFYELCGSYMPRVENSKLTIDFVNSELVEGIQNDSWIILDEINLATQTVIEGLNSLLDHRKELYLNETIKASAGTRIFATMNDFSAKDGRKTLPKSFLDRFKIIDMNDYDEEDIMFIITKHIEKTKTNIKRRHDEEYEIVKELNNVKVLRTIKSCDVISMQQMCLKKIESGYSLRNMFAYLKILINDNENVQYKYLNNVFTMKSSCMLLESICNLDNSYVLAHKNINQIMQILLCIINNIPVIISGEIGKTSIIEFVCRILNMHKYTFYCHNEIDCNDLLGQFIYKDNLFSWQNSLLLENCTKNDTLIVFDKPEYIQKAVFDRLNALFEGQTSINIHEKGYDTKTSIGNNIGIVLLCNTVEGLSNAVIDRCWNVKLSTEFDIIDINKICNKTIIQDEMITKKVKENSCRGNLLLDFYDITTLSNDYNTSRITNFYTLEYENIPYFNNIVEETSIRRLINLNLNRFEYTEEEFEIKKRSDFEKLLQFYTTINYNIRVHDNDYDKLKSMSKYKTVEKQVISFMKNCNLSILSEKPKNIDQLKLDIFQYIINTTIGKYNKCKKFVKYCKNLHIESEHIVFDSYYNNFMSVILGIKGKAFDPLLLIKIETIAKYNAKFEILRINLIDEFAKLYKYGKSNIELAVSKLAKLITRTEKRLCKISAMLERNLHYYMKDIRSNDIFYIISQLQATNLFSDICDYSLLKEYSKENIIQPFTLWSIYVIQNNILQSQRSILFDLLKRYNIQLNKDFSKNFFSDTETYCEMLFSDNKNYEINQQDHEAFLELINYDNKVFDYAFAHLFATTNKYKINLYPKCKIKLTKSLYNAINALEDIELRTKIKNLSIMATPEYILEHYTSPELLNYYQSCTKSFDWDYNHSWRVMLHLMDFTQERITEYLLNTKVYQYIERQYFIKKYLTEQNCKQGVDLLYNMSLQYEAFEIQKKYDNYKEENQKKIWFDNTPFTKYKKILQEDTLSHIGTILINQDDFICQCVNCKPDSTDPIRKHQLSILSKDKSCICFFEFKNTTQLYELFYTKIDIASLFYSRIVRQKYNNYELQLAKVFNEYLQVVESFKTKERCIIDGLLSLAMEEKVCINILLLIHQIIEKNKKYETENDGDGLKEGTGEKNISEDIKHEEEICEDVKFEDIGEVEESDGVENSNDGGINDVTNSSEYSSQETIGCEEEIFESGDEGSTEEINNCDNEFSDFDEKTISDENVDCNEEETDDKDGEIESQNEITAYKPIVGTLNEEQTCDNAEKYSSHVKGSKSENMGAQENEGEEFIQNNNIEFEENTDTNAVKLGIVNEENMIKDIDNNCIKLVNLLKYVFYGNKRNKYNGDYRSGKKLNMKKIIPFILSDYRKDKIWLKRNRMEKRDYIVRIFVDNSQSMNQKSIVDRLSEIFTNLTKVFEILEIPIEIYSFGASLVFYNNREDFFNNVRFNQCNTNIGWIGSFKDGINIILTDGIFQVQSEVNHNFVLLLINSNKIHTMKKIIITEDGILTKRYIDSLKLRYCIVNEIDKLEDEFVSAMKELVTKGSQ